MSSREALDQFGRTEKNRPSLLTRRWRVGLFTGLYLYQGTVAGFATLALANHLAANGHGAGAVGSLLALVGLPWVLQPLLWGPLLDGSAPHPMGAHRVWLVRGLFGGQIALCLLPFLGARPDPTTLGAVLLLHSLCASLADTATDRMIVANVPEGELGRVSACTRAGFVTGSALGAALFGWLLPEIGLPAAAGLLLILTAVLVVTASLVRERPGDALLRVGLPSGSIISGAPRALAAHGRGVARVFAAFRHREALLLLALCFGIDFALALLQVPFAVAMVRDHGWEAGALSQVQALLAFLGGTLGAGLVGFAVDRAGPAPALRRLCLACAAAFAVIALLVLGGFEARGGPLILGLASVVPALLYVALQPTVVLASRTQGVSATQFQIFMAAMNLGDVAGASLAGAVERWASPTATACGVALVFLLASMRGR
ncbi:PAT family beta-lactamase induction signal transducer AmpG [Methylorubrum rhodinum]|uniref:PAT family beta-lactamase induction signal transducer AmpG n=1 Tax=Methylorubrum rhodinum TaxID=29428 RepID=A0A840ZKX3_9HYPH|nr:MFS transporter [Methylorubrum rhodinum]MBB5757804.1 PAT family beta-lactamase induction signal transducer AmpG [Methylorubrum rhodinum]